LPDLFYLLPGKNGNNNKNDLAHVQCLKLKKNPGCPYFKNWATKHVNLVTLMNPWLPVRKTYTFKCTTHKNIHFCLLSKEIKNLRTIMVTILPLFTRRVESHGGQA